MAEYASATFWPGGAIRTLVALVIGVVVALIAWQVGLPLVSGVVALFALFMVGIFAFTLVAESRKRLGRGRSPDRRSS